MRFMKGKKGQLRNLCRWGMLGSVLVGVSACEMDIPNLNNPDRTRAIGNPEDIEALIAGAFNVWVNGLHSQIGTGFLLPGMGTEATSTSDFDAFIRQTTEPRPPYENSTQITATVQARGPIQAWLQLNSAAAAAYEGLRAIRVDGLTIVDASRTARAEAFAAYIRGLAWGYQAMMYDVAIILPETTALASDPGAQARESRVPYTQALEFAIESIEQAIAIAEQHQVTFPSSGTSNVWFTSLDPIDTQTFVQMAHTTIARLLVLSARTPQERRAVDWNRVLTHTNQGLTTDLSFRLGSGFRNSNHIQYMGLNTAGCARCLRVDYRAIGAADTSGQFQAWINAHYSERDRFDIVTPDRRITGLTPNSSGRYFTYRADNNAFSSQAGQWRFSAYQWTRHANELGTNPPSHNQGHATWIRADENNLLRAEAHIHLGNLQAAADLINISRTRQHPIGGVLQPGLPPLTAAGVPASADCVPRTNQGACADIYTALRYERSIELMGQDPYRGYADNRGFGSLADGTALHLPIAEPDLLNMELEVYTFGGPDSEWAAVYNPVTYPW